MCDYMNVFNLVVYKYGNELLARVSKIANKLTISLVVGETTVAVNLIL